MDGGKLLTRMSRNGYYCNVIQNANDQIGYFTSGDLSYMKFYDWYMWVDASGHLLTSTTAPVDLSSPGINQGIRNE